jgi:hypothetical protein
MSRSTTVRLLFVFTLLACADLWRPAAVAFAQGVTTSGVTGVVHDSQGGVVPGVTITAVHEPSGTTYSGVTQGEGRYTIQGMRVGGPYKVTAELSGFRTEAQSDISLALGIVQDVNFTLALATVSETLEVVGKIDPVFSSTRTGAATSVSRDEIAVIPTLNGRISDVVRLTPQANGGNFGGADNRMNNITIDGSSFNNSFGLGGQPGDRSGVAPISLEAIEQIQVSVAPYDVRQGSFIGAGVNGVTRSGTNKLTGAFYHRFRNQDWVGTEAKGQPVDPGTFDFRNTGGWASGPIIRNKLFAFGNYEDQLDKRPLTTWRANNGGEPLSGTVTRVLASDMTGLSSFLSSKFNYDTGPFNNIPKETPAKRFLIRGDYNVNNSNKVSFRYNYLDSYTDSYMSGSTSALSGRSTNSTSFLTFQNSNYQVKENIRSGVGEWNSTFGNSISNTAQVGYAFQDESRGYKSEMFPFVDIFKDGTSYTTFGFEAFTVDNALSYKTLQFQDNLTKFFGTQHGVTFGFYAEKYHSDNIFFGCCPQGAWAYNSLDDFYADANGYLANPNRTVGAVAAKQFQVRWSNIPGLDKPLQPLDVWYTAGYAQDEWRPRRNVTVTGGIRFDVSSFKNTAYRNAAADALTFRSETGAPIQYSTGDMPETKVLWSPRVGVNWDVLGDATTQVRGGTGLFSGRPAYVWISNQVGNTGVLIGERIVNAPGTAFPFTTNPSIYYGAATGTNASSYALNVTDADFKFPQVFRTNVALDRRLPYGIISTTEYMYTKDVNGIYYFNANLPAAQSSFTGVDNRPRWVGAACAANGQAGGCINRINNDPGNQVTANYVLKNGNEGHAWNFAETLSKNTNFGLSIRGAYSYGVSYTISDPESTAATSFSRNNQSADPNNPGAGISMWSPGHRVFALVNYTHEYIKHAATGLSLFWEARQSQINYPPGSSRLSYVFAGDMNGDGVSNNDLIYIPRNTSEMNFSAITNTAGVVLFTPEQQATAFDAYINQDPYLSKHRGEYAARNGLVMPMYASMDLSVTQDIFSSLSGHRHSFQIRLDIQNFTNMLNHNWGVAQRPVAAVNTNQQLQILTSPGVDSQGRATYRLATVNNQLITNTFQSSATTGTTPGAASDVYQWMLSLRYSFN